MSIYVTGDIHGELEVARLSSANFPEGKKLSKEDFVVILGDFALVWDRKQSETEKYWLKWLSGKPWTTLFVDGNHENFDRLLKYPVMDFHGGKASQIHYSVFYLRRGEIFRLNGKSCFVMGGAMSTDKENRIAGKSWWPQEEPNYKEWDNAAENLAAHNNWVDYVFTHTAPQSIVKEMITHSHCDIDSSRIEDPVSVAFERMRNDISFRHWDYAHFHCNWEYKQYRCLYNRIEELK